MIHLLSHRRCLECAESCYVFHPENQTLGEDMSVFRWLQNIVKPSGNSTALIVPCSACPCKCHTIVCYRSSLIHPITRAVGDAPTGVVYPHATYIILKIVHTSLLFSVNSICPSPRTFAGCFVPNRGTKCGAPPGSSTAGPCEVHRYCQPGPPRTAP
jgi:hypothetical protein